MTPEELEAIREDLKFGLLPGLVTQQVRDLLAEVERLRGVVADAEQAKRAVLKWANSCHHVGCECDNTLADELPDDWMAVAALEEGE